MRKYGLSRHGLAAICCVTIFAGCSSSSALSKSLTPTTRAVASKSEVAYVAGPDFHMYALLAASGQVRWVSQDGAYFAPILLDHGVIYVYTQGLNSYPYLTSLRASDGVVLWQVTLCQKTNFCGSSVAIEIDATKIYVTVSAGYVLAMDKATGERIWEYHQQGLDYLDDAALSGNLLLVAGNSLYVNGTFALNTLDGSEVWTSNDIAGKLALVSGAGETILVVADSQTLSAVRALDGAPMWKDVLGGSPVIPTATPSGGAILASADKLLYAVDPKVGALLWQATPGARLTKPNATDDIVYVGDADGTVHSISIRNGKTLWQIGLGSPISAPVTIGDGIVLAGTADGHIYAFDAHNGHQFWKFVIHNNPAGMGVGGIAVG